MGIITYLTTIRFAPGAVADLAEDLGALGIRAPLLVTDHGLAGTGLIDGLCDRVPAMAGAPRFLDTPTNPTEAATLAALALYRERGCDGIVAIGGGSPMDLAKGVALLATHPGPLADYALILGGQARITAAVAPVIAIPTTAGTGSEVGRAALITLEDGRKLGFVSPHLIPRRALCDPDLTVGLPPALTAATGMDAITHCVETYLSPRDNPPAEAIALDGLRRAVAHIGTAVANGANPTARREMMMAALMGGLTFQKGLGAVHALSHPLGGYGDLKLHHGTLNAVILPHVLRFHADAVPEKMAALAAAFGLASGADLADAVAGLTARLGLPATLSAMGVPEAILPAVASSALQDHSHATNPKPVTQADYLALLHAAFA